MQFFHPLMRAALVLFGSSLVTVFAGVVGTPLSSCDDLQNKINLDLSGHYYLTQDINCENEPFTPIGVGIAAFSGKLDGGIYDADGNYTGQNYTVSNFYIAADTAPVDTLNDDAH
ncbi:MAG TPA: hypothetical protein VI522_03710, partial [Gammaproteobacteria bacterium]|nr:hypothetical protein [Gammaproteobacteria bacterium]